MTEEQVRKAQSIHDRIKANEQVWKNLGNRCGRLRSWVEDGNVLSAQMIVTLSSSIEEEDIRLEVDRDTMRNVLHVLLGYTNGITNDLKEQFAAL